MNLQVGNDPLIVADMAPNPYFGPTSPTEHRQIVVVRTLRNDPIAVMVKKGQIDAAQYAAAREWQRLAEASGPRLKSSGHLQEPVDGSRPPAAGITDRQLDAHKRLLHYATLLGPRQHYLLVLVLDRGLSAWGATAALFPDDLGHERRRFTGLWFQEILSILARDMHLSN